MTTSDMISFPAHIQCQSLQLTISITQNKIKHFQINSNLTMNILYVKHSRFHDTNNDKKRQNQMYCSELASTIENYMICSFLSLCVCCSQKRDGTKAINVAFLRHLLRALPVLEKHHLVRHPVGRMRYSPLELITL